MEVVGWIGGFAFALCGLPQVVKCVREQNAQGISWGFLGLWLLGEVCTLVYVWPMAAWPLIMNYLVNIVFTAVILRYKLWYG